MSNTESKTEINNLLNRIDAMLYGAIDQSDYRPSYEDCQDIKGEIERIKELVNKDNWIPIEDKSQLEHTKEYIIQYDDKQVSASKYLFGQFELTIYGSKIKYYQPLPEAKT